MRICKTVMQQRLEAERRGKPQPRPPAEPDETRRPKLAATTPFESDSRTAWLLYLRSGQIAAR